MSAKAIVSGAVLLAVLGGLSARAVAQTPDASSQVPEQIPSPANPPMPAPMSPIGSVIPNPSQVPAVQAGLPAGSVPDPWITYDRPGCCGPLGSDGPIGYEGYVRTGVSIPAGNNVLQESLNAGWQTSAGARSLFFPATTSLQFAPVPVTIRAYERTALHMAAGWEWYLGNPAYCPGWHFRFGSDVGGKWGSSRLELNDVTVPDSIQYRHLYDVYGTVYLALHNDIEIPIGPCATVIAGWRAEWNNNWSDILHNADPHQTSNLQDINLLLNFGVRY
jgi:hypothetical protein